MPMSMRKFNGMVRKAIRQQQRAKVRADVALTAATANTLRLLTADDDPDYELVSNGTTICECESLSYIKSIDLKISYFAGTANAAGALVEWLLYRDVDNAALVSAPSDLFNATDTPTNAAIRKNVVAYGGFYSSANNDTKVLNLHIKRAALKRIRRMADGDALELVFITAASGAKYFIHGAINWEK